jgi:hypothetical protein
MKAGVTMLFYQVPQAYKFSSISFLKSKMECKPGGVRNTALLKQLDR